MVKHNFFRRANLTIIEHTFDPKWGLLHKIKYVTCKRADNICTPRNVFTMNENGPTQP